MRRAGPILAALFAAGLALGLITSTAFLAMGASDLQTTMESRLAEQPRPLGNAILQRLNETGVVEDFAFDARARQIRFVAVATLFGTALAVTFSRSLAGWTLEKPGSTASTATAQSGAGRRASSSSVGDIEEFVSGDEAQRGRWASTRRSKTSSGGASVACTPERQLATIPTPCIASQRSAPHSSDPATPSATRSTPKPNSSASKR